jgi:hypothetical protein
VILGLTVVSGSCRARECGAGGVERWCAGLFGPMRSVTIQTRRERRGRGEGRNERESFSPFHGLGFIGRIDRNRLDGVAHQGYN